MRRVFGEPATFAQRAEHERNVTLSEIAHAAMNEFRAAAAGGLAEVGAFEQDHVEAARGRIDGDASPGRSAANDDEVPRLAPVDRPPEQLIAIHSPLASQPVARP